MKKALFFIAILLIVWFIIRFVIGGAEDTWICVSGAWMKHGNPSSLIPTGSCI